MGSWRRTPQDRVTAAGCQWAEGLAPWQLVIGIGVGTCRSAGFLDSTRATIRNKIIEYNYALGGAGGVFAVRGSTVEDNIIQFNNLQTGDAATSAMEASGIIRRNIIRYYGEPVGRADMLTVLIHESDTGPATVVDNVIVNNNRPTTVTLSVCGGGIIGNNTIANNSNFDGAVRVAGGPHTYEITNSIVVHGDSGGLSCGDSPDSIVRCNNAWGTGQSYMDFCVTHVGVDGNISEDPMFCDVAAGDYRLAPESPCAPGNSPSGCGLVGALPICGTGAVAPGVVPSATALRLSVSPNPVLSSAEFQFDGTTSATLDIYAPLGRLIESVRPSGAFTWQPGREAVSGVYFARLQGEGVAQVVKFVVVR